MSVTEGGSRSPQGGPAGHGRPWRTSTCPSSARPPSPWAVLQGGGGLAGVDGLAILRQAAVSVHDNAEAQWWSLVVVARVESSDGAQEQLSRARERIKGERQMSVKFSLTPPHPLYKGGEM